MTEAQRNELLERFVASSGVAVEHGKGVPRFDHRTDTVRLPHPENFHSLMSITPPNCGSSSMPLAIHHGKPDSL